MKVYGYARVSVGSQKLDLQKEAIKKFCEDHNHTLVKIFTNISPSKRDNDSHIYGASIMENGFKDIINGNDNMEDNNEM